MVFNALCGRLCGGIGHWYLFKLTAGGHAKHLSHRLQSCLKITLQKVHHKVETVTAAVSIVATNKRATPFFVVKAESVTTATTGAWLVPVA